MITNDQGSAILIVLMVIVCITVLGLSSLNITGFDDNITGNFKRHEMTFNLTEGTMYASAKMVSDAVNKNKISEAIIQQGVLEAGTAESLFYELTGIVDHDYSSGNDVDIEFQYGASGLEDVNIPVDVVVDIQRNGAKTIKGGAAEFTLGGGGFKPDTALVYTFDVEGRGPANSSSSIEAIYYKVLGPETGL